VDESNERKQTPLHWAAMAGNLKTVKELLKLKADYNAQDDKALSPMHWAAMTGHEAVVRLVPPSPLFLIFFIYFKFVTFFYCGKYKTANKV
jgi:hypothetical protein